MTIEYVIEKPLKFSTFYLKDLLVKLPKVKQKFTYCGFVITCLPLHIPPGGYAGCYNKEPLSSADAEVYVRLSKDYNIIGENIPLDINGRFEYTQVWYSAFTLVASIPFSARIEVYQKTPDGEHSLYAGDHSFFDNQASTIFIDRDKVEIIPTHDPPTPSAGHYFGFERVGNIPVECIFKPTDPDLPSDEFIGYVDSSGDKLGTILGSADLKLKDYAFGGTLHLYANIGEGYGKQLIGGVDMSQIPIKYFRIKYDYENPETGEKVNNEYISNTFMNTKNIVGGISTEFMGPLHNHPGTGAPIPPTFVYPNPYETDTDKDWKYRGLIYVLNTLALPRNYGKYTFTIEPLDANMNPIQPPVANQADCKLILLIDNNHQALTGEIEDILRFDGTGTGPCGFLDLKGMQATQSSEIKVKYTINDFHGNLLYYRIRARYGKDKEINFVTKSYSRSGTSPHWKGVWHDLVAKGEVWQQCAYEFELGVHRRITNGFTSLCWKEFTYHITIESNNSYVP